MEYHDRLDSKLCTKVHFQQPVKNNYSRIRRLKIFVKTNEDHFSQHMFDWHFT